MQAHNPYGRVGLVDRPVTGDAQIVFFAPLAGPERRRAVVAGAGIDAVQNHHVGTLPTRTYRPIAQTVNMIIITAMNCSTTRQRISFCDRLGDPPRNML